MDPKPMPLPLEASCRCGQTKLKLTTQPMCTMACHCNGCQKMTSSAFSVSIAIPRDGFQVIKGEPVLCGTRNPRIPHYACPSCMTWLYTDMDIMPFIAVRLGILDSIQWVGPPWMECWTSEKAEWAKTSSKYSFPQFPQGSELELIVKDYSEAVSK